MNSQIFQNTRCKKSSIAKASHATSGASPAIMLLSAALLMTAVILFPERPAWGNDFDISIGPNGIQGYAHGVELIDILEVLADEGGYTFYIDKEMAQTLISFNIPGVVTAEQAIGQIIYPYSHAIIFGNGGWGKRRDGHDTLSWIASQDWCNGRVATMGGSAGPV